MIGLILLLAVVGFVMWLVETKIPMDPVIAVLIRVIVIVLVIVYLLGALGVADLPIPKLR